MIDLCIKVLDNGHLHCLPKAFQKTLLQEGEVNVQNH